MRMNKVGGIAYGAAAAVLLLLTARDVKNALLWLRDFSYDTDRFPLGVAAVAFATFGPFALSLWCWRLAGRVQRRWAVHLLFIPCAFAIVYAGAWLLEFADGPVSGEPAGYALVAAFLLFFLTVLVHAAALCAEIVTAIRNRRASVR